MFMRIGGCGKRFQAPEDREFFHGGFFRRARRSLLARYFYLIDWNICAILRRPGDVVHLRRLAF